MKIFTSTKTYQFAFETDGKNDAKWLKQNGKTVPYDLVRLGNNRYSLIADNKSYLVHMHDNEQETCLNFFGDAFRVVVEDERQQAFRKLINDSAKVIRDMDIRAPIPGLVAQIMAQTGQSIIKGDGLVVLEAMKMENVIKAPHDGVVSAVEIQEKQTVTKGQLLIRMKEES